MPFQYSGTENSTSAILPEMIEIGLSSLFAFSVDNSLARHRMARVGNYEHERTYLAFW
jgi:hypothetical protein